MKKYKLYIVIAIIVVILGAVVAVKVILTNAAIDTRRQNIPLVKVAKPTIGTISDKLDFNGDVMAIQQADIFSKVTGNIERIYVDMGAAVRRNQLLAVIDSTELYQQVQQTAATYYNARVLYTRNKQLYEQKLVAKQDLDNAEAQMKVAQANFETAKTRLSYARITAPFAGTITKRFLDEGALVATSNATLFTLMDLDSVKVIVNILEKDVPQISVGKTARIIVDAFPGKEYTGVITRLSEAIDLSTRTMAVEVGVPNKDHSLKPGMYATVTLTLAEHQNAVTVPTEAVLNDNNGIFVYTLQNGTVKRTAVTIGIERKSRMEVLSGLAGNEDVIVIGQQLVRDGGPATLQHN
ncbi:MAG TPA: efflux RND transporter periplasmic adaptor subunit [Bacteroidota bacterium]|nr:efflux RND transporter periplasmic adaptor subunit [Bacteroidota bacterium]